MFPTSHDITPRFLDDCVTVLKKLLAAGNEVLIVSKPHLECVERLCRELAEHKDKIVFRFTIGAMDDKLLRFWEPVRRLCGAAGSAEACPRAWIPHQRQRRAHAGRAARGGTLRGAGAVRHRYHLVRQDEHVRRRVEVKSAEDEAAVQKIEENQTDERIVELYGRLKDKPKVAWKDSFKKIVGLPAVGPVV